jgi:arylsulfatase A-like enzyme
MTNASVRNVLLIVADQWRGDCLGAMDHPSVQTPHLDGLAEDGVLFRRHYSQASPCGPARASLLTGLYQHNHRQILNETPLADDLPNLARLIRQSGRAPALFGYTDTPNDPRMTGSTAPWVCPGFDVIAGFFYHDLFRGWRDWMAAHGHTTTGPEDPAAIYLPVGGYDAAQPAAPTGYPAHLTDTAYLFGAALDHIADQGDTPWFVHLNCLKPHPPMVAPEPYNRLYEPGRLDVPDRLPDADDATGHHPYLAALAASQNLKEYFRRHRGLTEIDPAEDQAMRAAYFGNISEVDTQVGKVIDGLKALGRYDDTLIIFTSDHGEQLGDNWLYGRRGPFDGHFQVPLIIRGPATERGSAVEAFTEAVDILPTIAEALGLAAGVVDGRPLGGLLTGGRPDNWRSNAYWEQDFRDLLDNPRAAPHLALDPADCCFAAVTSDAYLYVHFPSLPPLLYDRVADPGCHHNIAGQAAHWRMEKDALQALLARRLSHQSPGLTGFRQAYGTTGPAERH